jgi:hypothetical protein
VSFLRLEDEDCEDQENYVTALQPYKYGRHHRDVFIEGAVLTKILR